MGTFIPLTQVGPYVSFLPPMGLSTAVTDPLGCCWSKASLRGEFFGSCATSTTSCSSRRLLSPPAAAKSISTVTGLNRTQSASCARVGTGLAPNLRCEQSGTASFGKLGVRSLVDEATARSSDLKDDLKASSSTTQNNDATIEGESSGYKLQSKEMVSRGQQRETEVEVYVDSSESELSSDSDEFGGGITIMEASPNPIEMDYEHMKVGRERNWSIADMRKMDVLRNFEYRVDSEKGDIVVQALRVEHMRAVVELLVDSFAELMGGLLTYRPLLTLTVRQYVRERYACLPDAVTLVGLYAPTEDNLAPDGSVDTESSSWLLAGTVELSFSNEGHPDIPAGPSPPPGSPYLCNMAVSTAYRRRGIGRQMLKAAEALAESQGCHDMYLHCRMVDTAPLNMYKGAGYEIVATDSILSLLSFQRRRYLMKKKLHPPRPSDDEEASSTSSL